ncbi:MAG: hypothetical protein FDZ70_09435, partial [Actinobacteria bacterium]
MVPRAVLAVAIVAAAAFLVPAAASASVTPLRVESVSFSDAQHGIITGGYGNMTGFVSTTEDGGTTWHAVRVEPNRWYRAGAAGEGSTSGLAADLFAGYSHVTPDLGSASTWNEYRHEQAPWFHGADMESATRGWLVGRGGPDPGDPAVIYTTNDAGATWTKTYAGRFYWTSQTYGEPYLTANAWLRCVDGADANTAWAIGLEPAARTLIQKTTNGGASWTTQTISGVDPEAGNTGSTRYEVYGVSAPSTQVAYGVGVADRIYTTTNGGATWSIRALSTITKVLYDVSMATTSTGWAAGSGGRVWKTTDGWATRAQQAGLPQVVRSIHAVSTSTVWAVGDNEMIMFSTDGGNAWQGCPSNRAPSARITAPATGTVITGASASIAGTATDGVGTGVATVSVSIRRDDARWWNGAAWQSTQAWLDADSTDWFDHWTYDWALEPGQNRERSYSLAWRAVDAVTNEATSGLVVTGLRIDNAAPALVSAYQVDPTHVRAVFSEAPAAGSVVATAFSIDGLSAITSASVVATAPTDVLIETSAHIAGQTYTLVAAAGAVADAYGNRSPAGSDDFTAAAGGPAPFLTVAQGSSAGRPTQPFFAAPGQTVVVDEIVLAAHVGTVTVTSLTVEAAGSEAASFAVDFAGVSLVRDADGDGRISAGDTTAAAAVPAGPAIALGLGTA